MQHVPLPSHCSQLTIDIGLHAPISKTRLQVGNGLAGSRPTDGLTLELAPELLCSHRREHRGSGA